MSILYIFLLVILVMVSLLLVLLILMQRPKSEGLGAAFGGGMTGDLFGAQTTNVLQKATRWLAGMFFLLALTLSFITSKTARAGGSQSLIQQKLSSAPAPKPMSEADKEKLTEQKIKEVLGKGAPAPANTGTPSPDGSPAPAAGGTSAPTTGLHAPPVQLAPIPQSGTSGSGGELQAPGIQLQTGTTGTAAPAQKTNQF